MDKYQLLGVGSDATERELRTAYLALMKSLHPDVAAKESNAACEVTEAYWILRDTDRRRQYDRERNAPIAARRGPSPPRRGRTLVSGRLKAPNLIPHSPHAGKYANALSISVGLVALGVLGWGLQTFALDPFSNVRPGGFALSQSRPVRTAAEPSAADKQLMMDAVIDFAQVRDAGGLAAAQTYSRRCLADYRRDPAHAMLVYCSAFDATAGVWQETRQGSQRLPYFEIGERRLRFSAASRVARQGGSDLLTIEEEVVNLFQELRVGQTGGLR
jgi:hypothetical protein